MALANQRINHQPVLLLASTPWRESSLLVEAFSRDYGRMLLLARSARKRQSELRGVLVPFVPLSASWYGSQELKTLHRAEWVGGWPQPQGQALFSALYVNELVLKLTAREDPHPALFDALHTVLAALARQAHMPTSLRYFEWTLLSVLGLAPDITQDADGQPIEMTAAYWLQPEHTPQRLMLGPAPSEYGICVSGQTLHALAHNQWPAGTAAQALRLNRMLLDFRLPEGIKSRQILQQLQRYHQPSV